MHATLTPLLVTWFPAHRAQDRRSAERSGALLTAFALPIGATGDVPDTELCEAVVMLFFARSRGNGLDAEGGAVVERWGGVLSAPVLAGSEPG